MSNILDIECEFDAYVECALWASIDGSQPMDENYGPEDIAPEALASMRADLESFIDSADPQALIFWLAELGAGQVGHDFWLTRNGHGTGFWDRFSRGVGAAFGRYLTELAKPYGESNLYVGDDGKVYVA